MNLSDQLRDISGVSEVGVKPIQHFHHLGQFTHSLSPSPSVDHGLIWRICSGLNFENLKSVS